MAGTLNIRRILDAKGTRDVFMLSQDVPLSTVVREACARKMGAVLLSGPDGKLAGIITERDVLHQCNQRVDFDHTLASSVMQKNLIVARPDDDINCVMDLMVNRSIRHLPVVSDQGLEGIITVRDLMFAIRKSDREAVDEFVKYLQTAMPVREGDPKVNQEDVSRG